MSTSSPKPRCSKCRNVLIQGNAIEVVGRIECGKCGHVNVLVIKRPATAAVK